MIIVNQKGLNQIQFRQGEDVTINVPIIDNYNYPVDVSTCNDILAVLRVNNIEFSQYTLVPRPGIGSIEVDLAYNNVIKIKVTREQSKSFPTGRVNVTFVLQLPDGAGGFKNDEYTVEVGSVITGLAKNQNLI